METMTIEDIAQLMRCSVVTARRKVKDPTFPDTVSVGRRLLWTRESVENWMQQQADDAALVRRLSAEYAGQEQPADWRSEAINIRAVLDGVALSIEHLVPTAFKSITAEDRELIQKILDNEISLVSEAERVKQILRKISEITTTK